jgi:hypothetical protein
VLRVATNNHRRRKRNGVVEPHSDTTQFAAHQ